MDSVMGATAAPMAAREAPRTIHIWRKQHGALPLAPCPFGLTLPSALASLQGLPMESPWAAPCALQSSLGSVNAPHAGTHSGPLARRTRASVPYRSSLDTCSAVSRSRHQPE